jgi:hypothetical protein
MPLSRLDNFLKNSEGNILYVNPSDFDATDSIENRGNSLTRPFRTIQRALLESARFSYQSGRNNDLIDRTTILVYPGVHYIDNRPGFSVQEVSGAAVFKQLLNYQWTTAGATISEFTLNSNFDIFDENNDLRKFNSTEGGVILPRGTSIVGLDLRKTKIRPLYVPSPLNDQVNPSAIFKVTGTCYFSAFTLFDADPQRACYRDSTNNKVAPNFSHHKLTCFEYADGVNNVILDGQTTNLTDLEIYYYKLTHAYGESSGRSLANFPSAGGTDFEPSVDEFRIVGDSQPNALGITSVRAGNGVTPTTTVTIETNRDHNLFKDTPILISGITTNPVSYTGSFLVSNIISDTKFQYIAPETPSNPLPGFNEILNASATVESDSVSSASPYIFSCTLRSVFGMNGMFGDGNKATGFKSMLTAQFTGISLQKDPNAFILYDPTTGIYNNNLTVSESQKPLHTNSNAIYRPGFESFHMKVANDAIFQCVSIFAIGYARHFVAESGGDMSITNSNSNFGAISLESAGFRDESFDRDDVGYITHVIPPRETTPRISNVTWLSLDATKIISAGNTSRLYIAGYDKLDIPPPTQIDSYKVGAKTNEELSLSLIIGTQESNFKAPILMQVPSGIGTSSQKIYEVGRSSGINLISSNIFSLTSNHQLSTGEKVRIFSDSGEMPANIESNKIYFVITIGLAANQIKLAGSLNDANANNPIFGISDRGGVLSIISAVADKKPGELGHPIQFDTSQTNWYVNTTPVTLYNTIYGGIVGIGTEIIGEETGATFITRRVDNRGLNEKLYRLRYVIPKEFGNSRPPTDGFILQETKNVGIGSVTFLTSNLANPTQLRNPKIIKTAGWVGDLVTITTELPHKLLPKDIVKISKIQSTNNLNSTDNLGFNGDFEVKSVPSPKSFTYTLTTNPGTFLNKVNERSTQQQIDSLPTFQRKKYKDSLYVYRSQELKKLIPGPDGQDGVYHLTAVCGSIGIDENIGFGLSFKKFNQDTRNLFPQSDRDNYESDPEPTVTYAELSPLGKVTTNDRRNSITREGLNYFLQNSRVGFAVTGAIVSGTGNTTITLFTDIDHNFNSVKSLTLTNPGAGYNNSSGVTTTIFSAELVNGSIDGRHATVKVAVSAANTITSVEIVDAGCTYGVGNTMTISSFPAGNPTTSAVVQVTEINNHVGSSLDLNGFADPLYNGTYKIVSVPSARTISIENRKGISASYRQRTDNRRPHIFLGSVGIAITSFNFTRQSGIVTVTSVDSHGLLPGNSFTVVGSGSTFFENKFFVQESVGVKTFTFNAGITTFTQTIGNILNISIHKTGLSANATAIGFGEESLGGRGNYMYAGITTTVSSLITKSDSTITLTSSNGFTRGDYIVIDSEILRLANNPTSGTFAVNRGQFSTIAADHVINSSVKKITILPMEIRRHSILRASGHTFEYLGFGPGNYSTALPINQDRILSNDEILITQSLQQDGGAVVYTGMNDRGEFFNGTSKINAQTGEEETLQAPVVSFYGEEEESELTRRNSGIYDDLIVRERITVEGGENSNQTSQFYGPVNFSEKVTSSSDAGLETKDLYIKGVASQSKLFTVGISTPTNTPKIGDISYLSNPDPGGYIGHVYSDNDWRRWGMISRDKNRDFLVIDQLGVGETAGIYNFTDAAEVNGTLKVKNLYVGGAVTFAGAQAIGNASFDNIDINKTIRFVGVGTNYTIRTDNANTIAQFQNLEVIGTAVTFTNPTVRFENSFNSVFSGISTIAGTLIVSNLVSNSGVLTATNFQGTNLNTNIISVASSAFISSGIVTAIQAQYLGGISAAKPLILNANSGIITTLTGTAATITTFNSTTSTISVLRASNNFFTPQLYAVSGIVTTLSGINLTYDRSNVGLSTVTNQVITDWIGTPALYANIGFTSTLIASYIGGGLNGTPLSITANTGIITSLTGVAATITSVVATNNLVSQNQLYSPVGVVTIMSGTQANYTGIVTASRFESTIAQGAAPIIVASNTLVTNLNADQWDGYNLSTRTNWSSNSAGDIVVGQLSWKNFGNNHTIFDASAGTSPAGGAVNNTNAAVAWTATYPTLMGWNGSQTYGIRVDSARVADTAATVTLGDAAANQVIFKNSSNVTTGSANLTFDGTNLTVAGYVDVTSDRKFKTNIKTIQNGLEKVLNLRGVEYDRIDVTGHHIGVIAQELEEVVPEAVSTNSETGTKSVAYGNLVGVLIEAIKDLKVEISELRSEIEVLKSK